MQRAWDISVIIGCIVIIAAITLHCCQSSEYKHEMEQYRKDFPFIAAVLAKKKVSDCEMEKTDYGYKCTDRQGRVFKVTKP